MEATNISSLGFKFPNKKRQQTTAYHIFPHSDGRCPLHAFNVTTSHFMNRPGSKRRLIVTDGSEGDQSRIADMLTSTRGTIWDMVKYYMEGATISFNDNAVAVVVYKRISDHFEYHLKAARTHNNYTPPPIEEMEALSEFAMGIRPIAKIADPDLDRKAKPTLARGWFGNRISFSRAEPVEVEEQPDHELETAARKLDSVQQYLETIGYTL